jgi:hypothetical protein
MEKSSRYQTPASGGRMTRPVCGLSARASSLATLVSSDGRLAPTRSGKSSGLAGPGRLRPMKGDYRLAAALAHSAITAATSEYT